MNHNKINYNKILLITLSIILSLSLIITINIIQYGKKSKTIEIINKDAGTMQISQIIIGGTNKPLTDFVDNNNKYDEEYNLLYNTNKEDKGTLKIKTNLLKNIRIVFINNIDNSKKILIKENAFDVKEEIINTNSKEITFQEFNYSETIPNLILKSIKESKLAKKIMIVLYILLLTIIFYYLLSYVNKIINKSKDNKLKFFEVVGLILSITFIFASHIYLFIELLNIYYVIIYLLVLLFFIFKYKANFKQVENIFLIFSILFGIIFVLVNPPFNVPDEGAHYLRAYNLTFNKEENKKYITNKDTYDANISIPRSLITTRDNYMADLSNPEFKLSQKVLLSDFNQKIENGKKDRINVWFGNTHTLNAFCYLPSTLMIKICRIFNFSVLTSVILSRLINLMIFIIIIYNSIIIVPKFKKTFLTVGLLPIVIQQAAAINQDSLTHTIAIFLIALIIKLIYTKNIDNKEFVPIAILAIMLSVCKIGYFPILFMLLLIPKRSKTNKKTNYIIYLIIAINIILTLINLKIMNNASTISPSNYYTIKMMLNNPFKTAKIFIKTYIDRFPLDQLNGLVNGFGYSTKWGKYGMLSYIIQTIILLIYLTCNNDEAEKKEINIKQRIFILMIMLLVIGIIYTALLTGYSPPNTLTVNGLQSRYFIPIIPLMLIIISNKYIKLNVKNKNLIYSYGIVIIMTITLFTIIQGFYV